MLLWGPQSLLSTSLGQKQTENQVESALPAQLCSPMVFYRGSLWGKCHFPGD